MILRGSKDALRRSSTRMGLTGCFGLGMWSLDAIVLFVYVIYIMYYYFMIKRKGDFYEFLSDSIILLVAIIIAS